MPGDDSRDHGENVKAYRYTPGCPAAVRGRKPGTRNKFSKLKQSFLDAFNSQELGGTEGLIAWACKSNENRTNFYKFIVQLMPKDVKLSGDRDNPVARKVVIEIKDASLEGMTEEEELEDKTIDLHLTDAEVAQVGHDVIGEKVDGRS